MKRIGNIYHKIYDMDNLRLAAKKAMKGKGCQKGVQEFKKDEEGNLWKLHYMLRSKTYKTSPYHVFTIVEEKVREIFSLPFFPDRVAHHALMLQIEPILTKMFTSDTYSCISGRGPHKALYAIKDALRDVENTKYFLKLDIKKFYPSIDHDILKKLLGRKFKDNDLLNLLDEIIDSVGGLPIGSYPSQILANFYLTGFDYWIKSAEGGGRFVLLPVLRRSCNTWTK